MIRDPRYVTLHYAVAAALAVSMLTLGACQERRYGQYLHPRDTVSLSAGDAIAHNKAIHAIDPWPAHARDPGHTTDGKRMMVGMERYQKNESLEPQGLSTNDVYDDQTPPAGPGGNPPPAP